MVLAWTFPPPFPHPVGFRASRLGWDPSGQEEKRLWGGSCHFLFQEGQSPLNSVLLERVKSGDTKTHTPTLI